jgi:ABC-2 type transport system ATP-binding protein
MPRDPETNEDMTAEGGAVKDQSTLPENAVEARGLDKVYRASGKTGEKHALKAVDLTIPRGGIFGLLGPNGAGKSTFINILAGLVNKTGGEAAIWGYDIDRQTRQARASIGVVPQELNIDPFFTPYELLELQAGLYGVPPKERQTMAILEKLGLADKAKAYARTLSGGMRRRLMVAKSMVHNPPVLVLDEPTAGVDIELRQQLWGQVRQLNEMGVTIVLTTHYLEEAEELCDRIAIISHGEVIACDTTQALLKRLDNKTLTITFAESFDSVPPAFKAFQPEKLGENSLRFQYRASNSPLPKILEAATNAHLTPVDVSTLETDLEDIFLQLTRGAHERADS